MTASKKIRGVMVMGSTGIGGAQAFVLNVLRNIDTNKFLTSYEEFFANETINCEKDLYIDDLCESYVDEYKILNKYRNQ